MFDYLNDLITNNADGTVTIGGVTYATDGSGIIDNYGGLTRDQIDAADAAVNDPFGTMAANAFMVPGADGVNVFDASGGTDDFSQLLISGGATPSVDDTITGATGTDTVDGGAGNDIIDGGGGTDTVTGGGGTDTVTGGGGTDTVTGGGGTDTIPASTYQELYDALVARGLGSSAQFFIEGSSTLDDIIGRYGGDESFMDLVNRYDPKTRPEFTGSYTYNPYNQGFGSGTGKNQVYYIDPTTNKPAMGLASEVNALYPGITTYNSPMDLSQQNPGSFDDTTTTDTTTNTGPNYEDLYGNLVSEYQRLLDQQNQPSNQTGSGDMSGLMGLLNQFMQSRNSLQGGGRYNNMYGTMYGGGMGYGSPYGNPFNSGMGYGYGMNPYAGGIGSFYGNTGLGFSPSGYNSGYGSGYGMNNMFYGGFGGNNYNQQQMAYNPYSSLYNQLSNPQTYGYSGDIYTPEYNSYLNTQYEGDRYSQGYQDYLQSNNPGVYNNLFGGSV